MTEQVFEKVLDCGQVFSVFGLFGGSLLCHGHVSGTHRVYDVYISVYIYTLCCQYPHCHFTPVVPYQHFVYTKQCFGRVNYKEINTLQDV